MNIKLLAPEIKRRFINFLRKYLLAEIFVFAMFCESVITIQRFLKDLCADMHFLRHFSD